MASNNFLPRPQKKRGNNGGDRQFIYKDSKQSNKTLERGRIIGQKLLKTTLYGKNSTTELTFNLYTYKLNEIPGIIDEIVRSVVVDGQEIRRICFETGYGKPKKAVEIRKTANLFLLNTLGYESNRGGGPKTFKMLNDKANRIVVFPQEYVDYAREQQEAEDAKQAIVDAKVAKQQRKEAKKRKKYFVHNRKKKMQKHLYPEPKKRRLPLWDSPENFHEGHEAVDPRLFTPGGPPGDNNAYRPDIPKESDDSDDSNSSGVHEETESTFLQNFVNLQVAMMDGDGDQHKQPGKGKKKKDPDKVDIFNGVQDKSAKFEYEPPDAFRYKKKEENPTSSDLTSTSKHHDSIYLDQLNSSGPWNCEFCSFRNRSEDDICRSCYAESFKLRYQQFMNVVDDNKVQNQQQIEHKERLKKRKEPINAENDGRRKWQCSLCTFVNTGNGEECSMCGRVDEYRQQKLDAKYGLLELLNEEKKEDDEMIEDPVTALSGTFTLREDKKGRKIKKFKSKTKGKKKMADDKLMKSSQYSESGQIANIHREWHANMWKQHKLHDPSRRATPHSRTNQNRKMINGVQKMNGHQTKHKQKQMQSLNMNGLNQLNAQKSLSSSKRREKKKEAVNAPQILLPSSSSKERSSKIIINRHQIGPKSRNQQNRWNNVQNKGKAQNPWDGNTDHVQRDFAGGFVPHPHLSGKGKRKEENGKRGDNEQNNGYRKGKQVETTKSKKTKRQIRREREEQRHKLKESDRGRRRLSDESEDEEENDDDSEEVEVEETEDRMEWMEKMINMGFEADKVFEAIAQSKNFNEALERVMQSVV